MLLNSYLEVLYRGGGQRGIRLRPYTTSTSMSDDYFVYLCSELPKAK